VLRRPLESAQYTSICYAERLEEIGAVRSVGSKGDSYDNAAAESLNSPDAAVQAWIIVTTRLRPGLATPMMPKTAASGPATVNGSHASGITAIADLAPDGRVLGGIPYDDGGGAHRVTEQADPRTVHPRQSEQVIDGDIQIAAERRELPRSDAARPPPRRRRTLRPTAPRPHERLGADSQP
jgi:hypothetical protein